MSHPASESNPECPGCQALRERVAELEALVGQLHTTMGELQARLNRNSSNSSQPPSADAPGTPKSSPPPGAGRQRGGQRGHRGHHRDRVALGPDDVVHALFPAACAHCQHPFPDSPPEGEPQRHQVFELPPLQLQVIEYQLHARTCPHCRKRTRAPLPADAPTRQEGFALQAFATLLTGRHHVSRRQTQELLADLLGYSFSLGTLSALERDMARALESAYRDIAATVAAAARVNVDETGWREGKLRPYLWTVVSATATLFHIGSRTKETFVALLPDRANQIVGSDRYAAYIHLAPEGRQVCWAHLIRDFVGLGERPAARAQTVSRWALEIIHELFALWAQHQAGHLDRATLQQEALPLQDTFRTVLRLGTAGTCTKTATFCQQLLDREAALWTFLWELGVEPTNNAAERALRPAVLWRKKSSGHQSQTGKQFVERFLSVSATLRQQGRSVLPFLEATLRAVAAGNAPPRLLPAVPA